MKPEQVSKVVISQEEYNVSNYYDEVNRTKYTAERRRQLSALLGSTSKSRASSDTKSTTVSYSSSNDSKESDAPTFTVDITGSSGTDSGELTSINSKVSKIIGASGSVKDIDSSDYPSISTVDTKSAVDGSVTPGQCESVNGRASSNDVNPDEEISIVHIIKNPLNKPCAQLSYITDDPSLLTNSTVESHLTAGRPVENGPLSKTDEGPATDGREKRKTLAESETNRSEQQSRVCNGVRSRRVDSGDDSPCETDSLIGKTPEVQCSVIVHNVQDTENDSGDDEAVLCSSKLLSSESLS